MESDGEDLDNIFFEENENTDNADRADDTENVETSETAVKVPVPRRVVRNPRLKFNPDRLCGERGIPVLVDHFKNVKFKGPGHEIENLDKLLSKLEHWTHRLFPSMKFEECLQHIEKLGKKKQVQTCLRKIRLDMPILNKDFVNEEEDDNDDVMRNGDPEPVEMDAFDRLLGESQGVLNSGVPTTQNIMNSNSFDSPSPLQNSYGPGQVLGSAPNSGLTDEQKQRIEENKRLAIERRKARLAAAQENSCQSESSTSEIFSSQSASIQQNRSRNEENTSSATDALDMEFSNNTESLKDNFSHLNNQNTDDLGLDDLIDLVDEEESVSITNNHKSESGVELGIVNKENTKDHVSDLNHQNTENLKSNDLIDLVDEEENVSNENCLKSASSMEFVIVNDKNTKDDISDVNDQDIENLGLNDLMDTVCEEEPEVISDVPDKKVKSVHTDRNIDNKSNSKSNYKTSQQIEDTSILDITDVEMTAVDETTNCKNTDNLAMDSLLDLIDENSMDN